MIKLQLRLADRVGMCRLQRETATMFEAIAEVRKGGGVVRARARKRESG